MTDSAPAFVACGRPGFVDKRHVNHSEGEFARSTEALRDQYAGNAAARSGGASKATSNSSFRQKKSAKEKSLQPTSAPVAP